MLYRHKLWMTELSYYLRRKTRKCPINKDFAKKLHKNLKCTLIC